MPLNIQYINQDITTVEFGIIGHGVNCQRAMGSGVALAIKTKWPVVYDRFMQGPSGRNALGKVQMIPVSNDLYVANMFTQEFYGRDGKRYASPEAIEHAFQSIAYHAHSWQWPVYLPKIGAGLGGLDWEADVLPALNNATEDHHNINLTICTWGE